MKSFVLLILISLLAGCAGDSPKNSPKDATAQNSKLSADEARNAIRAHAPGFRACYEAYLKWSSSEIKSGRIVFNWTVQSDGRVADVVCSKNVFDDQEFENCMNDVISSIEFPQKKESTTINYPFIFQGRK